MYWWDTLITSRKYGHCICKCPSLRSFLENRGQRNGSGGLNGEQKAIWISGLLTGRLGGDEESSCLSSATV